MYGIPRPFDRQQFFDEGVDFTQINDGNGISIESLIPTCSYFSFQIFFVRYQKSQPIITIVHQAKKLES